MLRHKLSIFDRIVWRILGAVLLMGGTIHWLIIFGIIYEKSPPIVELYFHSLAFFSPLAGALMLSWREVGFKIGCCIAISQIPFHFYMIYLDNFENYQSNFDWYLRLIDCSIGIMGAIYYWSYTRRKKN